MRYIDLVKAVQGQMKSKLSCGMLDMILRTCFAVIARKLEQGEPVYIPEFGRFELTTAGPRVVAGNLDGQTSYQVPERKRIRFVPSATWVDELNGEGG